MNRQKKKTSAASTPEVHVKAIGRLLTQLRKQLIKSAGGKGTYSDYLKLLDFYSRSADAQPKYLSVTWVDPEWRKDPAA